MGKRSVKKNVTSFFLRKSRSAFRRIELKPLVSVASEAEVVPVGGKGVKKKAGSRLWMRFDRTGKSEVVELHKSTIMKMASIPARDLRILGPVFSRSSNILAREKAMVVNLESIKAIVTAEEVFLLDPLAHEVLPFVEHLRQKLYLKFPSKLHESGRVDLQREGEEESELPFEFQVLEIALEFVCTYLDSSVYDLDRNAYPVLDELAMNVNTKNLECVRSLKGNLTRLLARVQKVRDEIEHLLDHAEDMGQFYLTRKQIQNQQLEATVASVTSNSLVVAAPNLPRIISRTRRSASIVSFRSDDDNVEDLEMLLEAYFMQLEGTRNKILSMREYIDNTEDYVNIQLDNQRNELIQLQMVLSILSFAMTIDSLIVGLFGGNIPCSLYKVNNLFTPVAAATTGGCFLFFLIILGYARWKKLLGP